MTLGHIRMRFFNSELSGIKEAYWPKLLVRACSWIQLIARSETLAYWNNKEVVTQDEIKFYLLHNKEYDAIEISHIVELIKKDLNDGTIRSFMS